MTRKGKEGLERKYVGIYSAPEVAQKLFKAAENGVTSPGWERFRKLRVEKLRLSGCEPTIGKEHLLSVLKYADNSKYPLFILETNGILLGADRSYAKKLAKFKKLCNMNSRKGVYHG